MIPSPATTRKRGPVDKCEVCGRRFGPGKAESYDVLGHWLCWWCREVVLRWMDLYGFESPTDMPWGQGTTVLPV